MSETKNREVYADWITRFYASHDDIPDGRIDGELISKLIRCKDCKHFRKPSVAIDTSYCWYHAEDVNSEDDYCSMAERKEE